MYPSPIWGGRECGQWLRLRYLCPLEPGGAATHLRPPSLLCCLGARRVPRSGGAAFADCCPLTG